MRRPFAAACLVAVAMVTVPVAVVAAGDAKLVESAGTYYVTQINHGAIAKVVVDGGGNVTVSDMYISGLPTEGPDSAVFAADGTLIVSNFGAATISRVDVNSRKVITPVINKTPIDTVADLAVDPNGNDVWAIERGLGGPTALVRVDLGSGAVSAMNPDSVDAPGGITFNTDGTRLFVSSAGGAIYELDPHSGHIVRKADINGSPDGLTYDPATGYVFASGCGGLCELDTGGGGAPALRYVRTLTAGDGDGIAADGHGHVYMAEASCGDLCRLDVATNTVVTVAQTVAGSDDVTPLVGAGSAAGGACLKLASCFSGPLTAAIAAVGVALFMFVALSGYAGGTPPLPATAGHAATAHHVAAPPAAGHHVGAPTGSGGGAPPGGDQPSIAGRIQEEAGEKLAEMAGAGMEEGVGMALPEAEAEAMPPPFDAPAPPAIPEPPPLDAGASRVSRDDERDSQRHEEGPPR